jgi:AcrR family transcriptional regulator
MPSDLTRHAILDAAERLYADRGFADVTLRDIVAAANVNLAAVNYHFGSNERSAAARFMIRASIESVPPIRRIKNREIDHLRKFAAAMRRSLPGRDQVELYWGLHFALAMAHQTIRDSERLTKLSEGSCDLNDVQGIIERIVAVSVTALTGNEAANKMPARLVAREAR